MQDNKPAATVLVVEDEQALNDAYQTILRKEGFVVHAAYDGTEALEICKTIEPDVILLDLRMPEMGGIGFLEQYKAPEQHPNVRVIVFSNLDAQNEINQAYQLGAQRYMLKAWASPKELVKLIRDTLEQNTPQQQTIAQA